MNEDDVLLDVFVRSLADDQQAVVEQLDALESEGHIDGYKIHVWGEALDRDSALADSDVSDAIRNQIAAFQQWALAENLSVESVFETDGETIALPAVVVAEYEGPELVGMAPHWDGDDLVSVDAYLDEIELRRPRSLAEEANAASRLAVPSDD